MYILCINTIFISPADVEGKHVLVVEDNPVNQKIMTRFLQIKKCVAKSAWNGQEVRTFKCWSVAVVVVFVVVFLVVVFVVVVFVVVVFIVVVFVVVAVSIYPSIFPSIYKYRLIIASSLLIFSSFSNAVPNVEVFGPFFLSNIFPISS